MDYVIYFILTIGILVLVHEFGHFAAAKLSGMRADIFALGFGKRLFGWNKKSGFSFGELPKDFDGEGNTDYRLCLLPLGGYVKIAGMVDESFDTKFADAEPQPYEFRAKSAGKKIFVISAGVLMNVILSLVVFWSVYLFQPKHITKTTEVGVVAPGGPSDKMGFKQNDKIISVNGKNVYSWEDVTAEMFINNIGRDLHVKVLRENAESSILIPKKNIPDQNEKLVFLPKGVYPEIADLVPKSPAEEAGVQKGDRILSAAGINVSSREEAISIFEKNKSKSISLVVKRNGKETPLTVTPGSDGKVGAYIGDVYTGPVEYKSYGFFEAFSAGVTEIVKLTELTFSMLGKVFTGSIEFKQAFGGPIKIAQFAAKSANSGFLSFIYFLSLLSLSLAIINIMPFPVLDGGHLIIIIIEAIIKREIPVKVKVAIQNTGFVLLLLLMAFIIYNDVLSLKLF
jgi:regulator of sigma E protease